MSLKRRNAYTIPARQHGGAGVHNSPRPRENTEEGEIEEGLLEYELFLEDCEGLLDIDKNPYQASSDSLLGEY